MIKNSFPKRFFPSLWTRTPAIGSKPEKKSNPARKAPSPEPAPEPAQPPGQTKTEDTHELILDALGAAGQELAEKPKMTPDRQALIQQALNVQRSKEHVLNGLSRKQREKLYVVAMKTLQSAPGPGVGKKALKRKKRGK